MERLWAPWRAQYIRESGTASSTACFLCRGLSEEDDRRDLLVWRRPRSAVFLNRFPYNNGHLLVCPREHAGSLRAFHGPDLSEPLETIQRVMAALDRMIRPEGYNIGVNQGKTAGAGLPDHLHWHVVPRWDGDTNFMPVVAGAKVIVESLDEFYDRLRAELAAEQPEGSPTTGPASLAAEGPARC